MPDDRAPAPEPITAAPAFLAGGEMASLIAAHDWSATPLGPAETWPQSLKVAVRLLLNTRHPMFIWWGPDLIQLYNDAYRETMGPEQHPSALGRAGRETWAEIWDIIGPQIDQVMGGGEATWHENQLVPTTRYGERREMYWTYGFSPIDDEASETGVGGVLVICRETTEEVLGRRRVEGRYDDLFAAIDTGFCILEMKFDEGGRAIDYRLAEINPAFERQTGLYGAAGKWVSEAVPGLERHWFDIYGQVALTGEAVRFENRAEAFGRWYDVHAFRTGAPEERRVGVLFHDVSERRLADERLRESEARYRTLFEAVDAGFCVVDVKLDDEGRAVDHFIVEANPAVERHAGLAGATGRWASEFAPGIEQRWHDVYAQVASTGEALRFEDSVGPFNRWYDVHVFRTGTSEQRRVAVLFNDITERKQAVDRLRQLNETLEARVKEATADRDRTWNNARDLLLVIDTDGVLRAVNPAWEALLGWREDELVGRSHLDVIHADDHPSSQGALGVASRGPLPTYENRIRHKDGSYRWISWVAAPEGELIYASGRDVTADKARAAELAEAHDALRQSQKVEALGQLTGGIAHDFNNLLTVIRSSSDLLRSRELSEERRRRYIDAISDTADRAAKLTGQLLAFARRQALRPEVFDARVRVQGIEEMLRTLLGSRVELGIEAGGDASFIEADAGQFETALVNLAVNARDAMNGEGKLTIAVRRASALPAVRGHKAAAGDFVAVSVTDTGCGIAPKHLDRIFEPFFTTKSVGQGTGLGLSQLFGFAKQSGGEVGVSSALGAGTTFTLYLPRADAARAVVAATPVRGSDAGRGQILVVEDNAEVGEFVTQLLGDLGYETALAADASGALARLERDAGAFDLVFSDVVMPGMDGVELGNRVRERWPGLPVVLTSGYSHVLAEDARHGFPVLHKPYSVEELSRVIRQGVARPA